MNPLNHESEMVAFVFRALEEEGLPYMLAGSFATFVYGVPRSTKDLDFVIELVQPTFDHLAARLDSVFTLDPQQYLETTTWTRRYILTARKSSFKVEFFIKDDDPHHMEQWLRRRRAWSSYAQREVWMPSPEDVIIQKVRWGRPQDLIDVGYVIAVQGSTLDMTFIRKWCAVHGSLTRLDSIVEELPTIPPL